MGTNLLVGLEGKWLNKVECEVVGGAMAALLGPMGSVF
jgi:ABC-type hemin transport system ATPase subunit